MSGERIKSAALPGTGSASVAKQQLFTIKVADSWYGIDIDKVRTVFKAANITRVPLAPPTIAGLVNVRGEVLTAINLHTYLGIASAHARDKYLLVGVIHEEEDFGLIVDAAGEILDVHDDDRISIPASSQQDAHRPALATFLSGERLISVLDIPSMLASIQTRTA